MISSNASSFWAPVKREEQHSPVVSQTCKRTKVPQCSTARLCATPCYSKAGRRYVAGKAIFLTIKKKFMRTMKHLEELLSLRCGACNPQTGRRTVNTLCYFAVLKYDVHLL